MLDPCDARHSTGGPAPHVEAEEGTAAFWLCRDTTRFGTFKIRGKLTTYDGYDQSSAWITPSYVRLHRWGR